jgi:phosphoglycolate phosphatase
MMTEAIILDFDGVILDSAKLKNEVFTKLYTLYPNIYEKAMRNHMKYPGATRYKKFKYVAKLASNPDLEKELAERFRFMLLTELVYAKYIPGALEFLEKYHAKIPLYIVSASPIDELDEITRSKKLANYFDKIYGNADNKERYIIDIVRNNDYSREDVIFVGDMLSDYRAAKKAGVGFVGIKNDYTKFPEDVETIDNLLLLSVYI